MKRFWALILCFFMFFNLSACKKNGKGFSFTQNKVNDTYSDSSSSNKYHEDFFKTESKVNISNNNSSDNSSESRSSNPSSTDRENEDLSGWYFKHCSVAQKEIYKKIDTAVYNMKSGYIYLGKCKYADVLLAFKAVLFDRPEYFWMPQEYVLKAEKGGYSIAFSGEGNVSYLCSKEARIIMETEMETSFLEIKRLCNTAENDYQKELIIHDWLIDKITYDTETVKNYKTKSSEVDALSFTAYAGLVSRSESGKSKAVCEGYAKAFKYVLKRFKINSILISGKLNGEGHMWNEVKINNSWYNVDVTADDTGDKVSHTFFNVSDKAIERTHKKDKDFYDVKIDAVENGEYNLFAPPCTAVTYNYFNVNNCLIKDLSTAPILIAEKISENLGENQIEFAFSDSLVEIYHSDTILRVVNMEEISKKVYEKTGKDLEFIILGAENSKAFVISW